MGRAGTGKSFCLGAAKAVWEGCGLRVHGIALSAIAADGLTKEGINSRTIESFRYALSQQTLQLYSGDVVVMDEAGMTDSESMLFVLRAVVNAKAKLVLVGDAAQLQPIGPGASFRALVERLGYVELHTVYRQQVDWQRQATHHFAAGRIAEALSLYDKHGCVHIETHADKALRKLADKWQALRKSGVELSQLLVVAHRNEDVDNLNQRLRQARINAQELSNAFKVSTKRGSLELAIGERLLFLKNDKHWGVSNGRLGTVMSFNVSESGHIQEFTVKLDGSEKIVTIHPDDYSDFTYGYAATVHKTQGVTVDHCLVYADGFGWNRYLAYVAQTRHRHSCQLYASSETYPSFKALVRQWSRLTLKDSLLDFPLAFAKRRGIETGYLLSRLQHHLGKRLSLLTQRLSEQIEQRFYPERYTKRLAQRAEQAFSEAHTQKRREDAKVVAAYVEANQRVGLAFKALSLKTVLSAETSLQSALAKRNQLAHQIVQDVSRYEKALAIYAIDTDKLSKQARQYTLHETVIAYRDASQQGKTIHRDRRAFQLMKDIKAVYPYLKANGLDTTLLKKEALTHVRRKCLSTLAPHQRQAFKTVETYHRISQHINRFIAHSLQSPQTVFSHAQLKKLEVLQREQEQLAHRIFQSESHYQHALDFFEIGKAQSHFHQPITSQQDSAAQKRWYKLQQAALRFEARQRVQDYHQACLNHHIPTRLQKAYEISQAAKDHHAAIVGLKDPREVWRSIRWDAKRYEQQQATLHLSIEERHAFKVVEALVEAKRTHAKVWREILDSKKTAGLSDEVFYSTLVNVASPYTKRRNQLAYDILGQEVLYQAALKYFAIDKASLEPYAYQHTCAKHCEDYLKALDFLEQGRLALNIIEDPKAHHGAMIERQLTWKAIVQKAKAFQQYQHFQTLTGEEKNVQRLIVKYRLANQRAGKWYARSKTLKNGGTHLDKIRSAFEKRDALAAKLIQATLAFCPAEAKAYLKEYRVDFEKVLQQSVRHHHQVQCAEKETSSLKQCAKASQGIKAKVTHEGPSAVAQTFATPLDFTLVMKKLRSDLNAQVMEVATRYLGEPKSKQGTTWRYGSRQGSLAITVKGDKQGLWWDFQTCEGGDMFHLIQKTLGDLSFKQTVEEATRFLKGAPIVYQKNLPAFSTMTKAAIIENKQHKIQKAQLIFQQSQPVTGTLAERYLREHRGIQGELWDKTFRFHPHLKNWMTKECYPALIIGARDIDDTLCGVQAIFLDPMTANKAPLQEYTKLSRGLIGEGALVHGTSSAKTIALAEGPETALSIADAHPDWQVYVTFGIANFYKVALKTKIPEIRLCVDNDGEGSSTAKGVAKTINKLQAAGRGVTICEVDKPADKEKWDFNDALRRYGVAKVKENLEKTTYYAPIRSDQTPEQNLTTSSSTPLKNSAGDLEEVGLEKLLLTYVEKELLQMRLMDEYFTVKSAESEMKKSLALKAQEHSESIDKLAQKILQHPRVKEKLQRWQNELPNTLVKHGGFAEIYERIKNNNSTSDDFKTLITQLKSREYQALKSQKQDRSRKD